MRNLQFPPNAWTEATTLVHFEQHSKLSLQASKEDSRNKRIFRYIRATCGIDTIHWLIPPNV